MNPIALVILILVTCPFLMLPLLVGVKLCGYFWEAGRAAYWQHHSQGNGNGKED
jgi:hypothetical protein